MDPNDISALIDEANQWVTLQRNKHRPSARPLSNSEKIDLGRFFECDTLERVRLEVVSQVEPPEFSLPLPDKAKTDLRLTFGRLAGIAFEDTIVISKTQMMFRSHMLPLLFHELMHVVQYETLGSYAFMERYVHGWLENGFSYHAIPLERDAYELQEWYEVSPEVSFSVSEEVGRRLGLLPREGTE
ncbi:MAG: hypothetical protein C4532_03940 [Candidatus Abyssobacteria bacterium SURF_17]|jgi:hypothetical protein|uniref:DUF4157 domain-containing protein n=1 Tax=Candidatus Abyssobacteria bacterium SURF_17 TaxID=2093361 RepID=A0A419F5Q4_9BACT|nr:MAG: hypothetical protein C4532_03940 [Candidatus Abyssubacteria bacterium SURF_17]